MGSHSSTLAAASLSISTHIVTSSLLRTSAISPSTIIVTITAVPASIPTAISAPTVASVAPSASSVPFFISVLISLISTPSAQSTILPSIPSTVSTSTSITPSVASLLRPSEVLGLAAVRLENSTDLTDLTTSSSSLSSAMVSATAIPNSIPALAISLQCVGRGPFAPPTAMLGDIPTNSLDFPITIVFLVLFLAGAATHMTIYNLNSKRGHTFILSDLFFDFYMVRTVTTTMRVVWAFRSENNSIVLAALIFESAGLVRPFISGLAPHSVSVIFAINLVLTQCVLPAIHPKIFWHSIANKFFLILLASVPFFIIFNIAVLSTSFFVTTTSGAKVTKDLLFLCSSWNLWLCLLLINFISILVTIPSPSRVENLDIGRLRIKIVILIYSSATLSIGAIVRLIAAAQTNPINAPGQVDSKAIFNLAGFFLETLVVFLFAAARFDLLFHIPDDCTGPGQYAGKKETDDEQVQQAIYDLKLNCEVVGTLMDAGNIEVLVYAFRVRKMGRRAEMPRRLPRSSTSMEWERGW